MHTDNPYLCLMKQILRSGDPMGAAIYDYHKTGKAGKLVVRSSMFDDDEIPVKDLFRSFDDMPYLEKLAFRVLQAAFLMSEQAADAIRWP